MAELNDLSAFVAVAQAGGFRDAARLGGVSPSSLSEAVRRLEAKLGVRLLNSTTRSIAPTEAGARLHERLAPALGEIDAAIDVVNAFRDRPAGTLRLNVPASVSRLVLPAIAPPFLKAYPDIRLEVVVEDEFVDVLASGCDAGVRYDERLEQDMIAVPIGPRVQSFVTAASPAYLDAHGRPEHPRDLLGHACLRGQFASGRTPSWDFEREGEVVRVDPAGPLTVRLGAAVDLAVSAAAAGSASSTCSRNGCVRNSTAAPSNRFWSHGARASRGLSSTIRAVVTCPRRCAPSSTSSSADAGRRGGGTRSNAAPA